MPTTAISSTSSPKRATAVNDVKPVKDYWERVAEDEEAPAGECPECGSLASFVGD